ncbi:MAG TPA: membrane dipeptidase [Candidatus Baltobacteraceae bacterium]|nr:membrane dipeptidase [Candidatus Baltobacteraceae bacterium]
MLRRSFLNTTVATAALAAAASRDAALASESTAAVPRPFLVDGSDVSALSPEYLDLLRKGGVQVMMWNSPGTLLDVSLALEFLEKHADRAALAKTVEEIDAVVRSGRLAVLFGFQDGLAFTEGAGNDWRDVNPPQTTLRAFYDLGLRAVNLTYNIANQFGGGCLDPSVPLSRAGKYMITTMQEMGILVDCGGHLGERSSLDVIAMARRPVICSHSNCKALNDNPRCTSDRVIEGIAKTGGVFGINAVDAFMTWGWKDAHKDLTRDIPAQETVARYVDEIDYLMKLVGPDHIGLGPDFTYGLDSFYVDPANQFEFPPEMTYKQHPVRFVKGFENISQLANVTSELRKRSYSQENIDKILGGNWMRVYRAAWS